MSRKKGNVHSSPSKQMLRGVDFGTVMCRYNPFGFKDENKEIKLYRDYSMAYYDMLERLFKLFPKGYVSVELFVVETYGVRLVDCQQFVSNFVSVGLISRVDGELPSGMFLMNWYEKTDYMKMEQFATALHFLTGTIFNKSMFLDAVARFRAKYNLFDKPE